MRAGARKGFRPFFFLSDFFRVDARQQLVDGRRLSRLRQEDLNSMAKAICGYERRLVRAERVFSRHVAYYRFVGQGLDCLVLATDYAKILPFILDGTFDPSQYPAPRTGNPSVPADLSTLDQWDSVFFNRVLGQLRALFPESYPTSDL